MSVEEDKAIVRRFAEEIWSRGNLDAAEELVARDVVDRNPFPEQAPGIEGIKQVVAAFRRGFPDAQFTIEDVIAEGDKVVTRWVGRGTNRGEFAGIAPTGRQVTMTGIDIFRIAGGRIVERWASQDDLRMMKQLGAIPVARQAGR